MNREIKFRVWNGDTMDYEPMLSLISTASVNEFFMRDSVVMQFTGLKDMSGKEIYEGDVVKVTHTESLSWNTEYIDTGIVVFDSGSFCVKCPKKGNERAKDVSKRSFFLHFNAKRSFEVLNNIHENPELLK